MHSAELSEPRENSIWQPRTLDLRKLTRAVRHTELLLLVWNRSCCSPCTRLVWVQPRLEEQGNIMLFPHKVLGNIRRILPLAEITEIHDNHFTVV